MPNLSVLLTGPRASLCQEVAAKLMSLVYLVLRKFRRLHLVGWTNNRNGVFALNNGTSYYTTVRPSHKAFLVMLHSMTWFKYLTLRMSQALALPWALPLGLAL